MLKAIYSHTKRELWEYYTGKADASVYAKKPFNFKLLRQDVDQYIQSNEEYIKAKQKVDYLNATVDFLDRTIRQITNRTFTIKNAIDWRKFTSGALMKHDKLFSTHVYLFDDVIDNNSLLQIRKDITSS